MGRRRLHQSLHRFAASQTCKYPPPIPPPPPSNETWDQKALREWQLEQAINEGARDRARALLNYQFDEKDIQFAKQFVKEKIEPLMEESKRDFAEEKEVTWSTSGLPEQHLKWVEGPTPGQVFGQTEGRAETHVGGLQREVEGLCRGDRKIREISLIDLSIPSLGTTCRTTRFFFAS